MTNFPTTLLPCSFRSKHSTCWLIDPLWSQHFILLVLTVAEDAGHRHKLVLLGLQSVEVAANRAEVAAIHHPVVLLHLLPWCGGIKDEQTLSPLSYLLNTHHCPTVTYIEMNGLYTLWIWQLFPETIMTHSALPYHCAKQTAAIISIKVNTQINRMNGQRSNSWHHIPNYKWEELWDCKIWYSLRMLELSFLALWILQHVSQILEMW